MTIEHLLQELSQQELFALLAEVEAWRTTGTMSMEAHTRLIAQQVFHEANVMQMDRVAHELYRLLALKYRDRAFH